MTLVLCCSASCLTLLLKSLVLGYIVFTPKLYKYMYLPSANAHFTLLIGPLYVFLLELLLGSKTFSGYHQ
jgi:hypothetical protein